MPQRGRTIIFSRKLRNLIQQQDILSICDTQKNKAVHITSIPLIPHGFSLLGFLKGGGGGDKHKERRPILTAGFEVNSKKNTLHCPILPLELIKSPYVTNHHTFTTSPHQVEVRSRLGTEVVPLLPSCINSTTTQLPPHPPVEEHQLGCHATSSEQLEGQF